MPAYGMIKDSPVITAAKKTIRKSKKRSTKQNGYGMLFAYAIVGPLRLIETLLDIANAKMEAYIEKQKETK